MKRRFSKKQRIALAQSYDWKCALCGCELPKNWHADHRIPFSKNGDTDVLNGQPLCPTCNLKKGNKTMSINLRSWQEDALSVSVDSFKQGEKLFLTHATPGGGKTIHGLSVFDEMKKQGIVTHLIVLAPSTTLVNQWGSDAKCFYNFELSKSMIYRGQPSFREYQGIVMTYQGMNENHEALRIFCSENPTLVCADEIHHVADGQSWGSAFNNAFDLSGTRILGLTGTPWSSNGQPIPYVEYNDEGYSIPDFAYGKKLAIADGVCRVTQFFPKKPTDLLFVDKDEGVVIGQYDDLEDAVADNVKGAYRKTLQSLKHFKSMFHDANDELTRLRKSGVHDAGGLIVACDIETAHKFQNELLIETGKEYPIVHSKMQKPHEKIKEFRESKERWLISVDMVTEGVDIKRLQVCVFLSTKNTELFLRQVIGRIERRRNDSSYIDKHAYFYYTETNDLQELIQKLDDENKAGEALSEEREAQEKLERSNGDSYLKNDSISLEDLTSEQNGLIADGHFYEKAIVAEALYRKRKDPANLGDIPTFVICKFINSENSWVYTHHEDKEEVELHNASNMPLYEKKEQTRKLIAKEVNYNLSKFLGRKPNGEEIRKAHLNINKRIGISRTDDSISLDLLNNKLEFVVGTRASTWL